mgnify:CR=1 FL=1
MADLLDELWRDPFVEYPPPRRLELLGREELREPRLKLIEALAAEDWRRAMRVRQALRESTVDETERAAVELYTAWIYAERGEWDRALDYYQTVIQGARGRDQRALEIEGLLGVGLCEAKRDNFDPADHVLSYARELARGTDSRPLELCALRRRALAAAAAGRGEQAVALLDEALRTANEARELWMVARLEQVLDNLLSNALAHTPADGCITLRVAERDRWATVAVEDTGAGIAEEEIPRIFERFYRGDRARRGPGTGLGLAIVKEIVLAHGGAIEVESAVGEGTTVLVKLPRDL